MDMERTVVVTGAGKGIGAVIARHLAASGRYRLLLVSRTAASLEATAEACRNAGAQVDTQALDLTDAAAVAAWQPTFAPGPIALVNNAGGYLGKPLAETTDADMLGQVEQNLMAGFRITRKLLPALEAGGDGRIITIGSIAAVQGLERGGAYAAGKHAVLGWSRSLRLELRHKGIAVTTVNIGPTWSSSWDGSDMDPARIMDPTDVARTIAYLLDMSPRTVAEEILLMPAKGDL